MFRCIRIEGTMCAQYIEAIVVLQLAFHFISVKYHSKATMINSPTLIVCMCTHAGCASMSTSQVCVTVSYTVSFTRLHSHILQINDNPSLGIWQWVCSCISKKHPLLPINTIAPFVENQLFFKTLFCKISKAILGNFFFQFRNDSIFLVISFLKRMLKFRFVLKWNKLDILVNIFRFSWYFLIHIFFRLVYLIEGAFLSIVSYRFSYI